ncbi:MAG: hypothetical protein DWB56_16580 [Candidatus Jettenia sp.]|uniref:hypothetical protein n=1 Tax=Candidatus Brocadia sinica TaxID=795830 RepID=UPI0006989A95|nr:hypothetical protein [Candidatus Brocadia sinica]KAA0241423.1 MAG: hypothetical protein EDM70_18130 [Candidatus Brocadia sp. AMX2]MBC6930534.1 hypothetical protein [Candidatus Jettenia sp.]MBL1170645.1 hypothetical protein [Candidatus Brocadia sp. AMX1]NOG43134.1 hypothetical protein [Planctomycetota bacterium]MCQ3928674.1 hypothetical protein [Candidatus Jettenia sp.]
MKFAAVPGRWNKDDDNTCHILIASQLTAFAKTVIAKLPVPAKIGSLVFWPFYMSFPFKIQNEARNLDTDLPTPACHHANIHIHKEQHGCSFAMS